MQKNYPLAMIAIKDALSGYACRWKSFSSICLAGEDSNAPWVHGEHPLFGVSTYPLPLSDIPVAETLPLMVSHAVQSCE